MRSSVIERAARDGVKLIISVDTGIRDIAVVERAGELGIEVIVTDHHLPDDELPRALAVLNPNQPGCEYPDKNLCGVGVAFKLAQALLGGLGWEDSRVERILTSLLKIAAIGTIADMVPLLGENRLIAKLGLDGLGSPSNAGLKELLSVSGFRNGKQPGAGDVAFRLAPRLNAAGRMDTANEVIELFTTSDQGRAAEIALKLNDLNTKRQQTETGIVEQILRNLGEPPPPEEMPVIVVDGEGWHLGVIGIVASRVIDRFHRPALVLNRDLATGLATGSARSIPGFHFLAALESAGELFERFGGHKQAAGCTLAIERIPELRERLNEFGRRVLKPEDFIPALSIDAELPFDRIHDETMEQLAALAPHGLGNPAPVFSAPRAELTAPARIIKERHLKLFLEQRAERLTAMGWRMGDRIEGLAPGTLLDAAFTVEPDDYRGGWQLYLKDFRRAEDSLASAE
jgi:single-stranded-DNA-specific exonuclease